MTESEWNCGQCREQAVDRRDEYGERIPYCVNGKCPYHNQVIPNYYHPQQ